MTTLGERITARREQYQEFIDAARQAAQDWAAQYTDDARSLITTWVNGQIANAVTQAQTYVDNKIATTAKDYVDSQIATTAKTYVDNQIVAAKGYVDAQITAAKTVGKNYTDTQIQKLKTDNNLI